MSISFSGPTPFICLANDLLPSERRSLVLHFLYSIEMSDYEYSIEDFIYKYRSGFGLVVEDTDPLIEIIREIVLKRVQLDEQIIPLSKNWKFERISIIVKLILRYAIWELSIKNVDPALAINEAVELAKGYAEKDSYRFVNGILDSWVKQKKT
jgi:N utilization substance protein B